MCRMVKLMVTCLYARIQLVHVYMRIHTVHVGLCIVEIILFRVIRFLSLIKIAVYRLIHDRILRRITMTGIYTFNLFDFFFTDKQNNDSS